MQLNCCQATRRHQDGDSPAILSGKAPCSFARQRRRPLRNVAVASAVRRTYVTFLSARPVPFVHNKKEKQSSAKKTSHVPLARAKQTSAFANFYNREFGQNVAGRVCKRGPAALMRHVGRTCKKSSPHDRF